MMCMGAVLFRCAGLDAQGVYVRVKHVAHGIVYHAVALQQRPVGKLRRDDEHAVMARAATGAGVADVAVAVVDEFEYQRGEGLLQPRAYALAAVAHGRTFLNGRTVTRAYTPPLM